MTVTILRPRLEMADAGRARVFTMGQVCDLPPVVAESLIATGWAAAVVAAPVRDVAAVVPPESGKRRRRAA